jgi:hypothetical protein
MNKGLLLALAFLVGCATPPAKMQNVALVWKPEKIPEASAGAATPELFKVNVRVAPMTDSRSDPALIGENRERQAARPVTTKDDVAAFVTTHFTALLKSVDISVVKNGETVVIKGDVQQFFVTETDNYNGEVRLGITLTDAAGNPLWTGTAIGKSNDLGHSYKLENYYESLSDALVAATSNLLQNQDFQAAITQK